MVILAMAAVVVAAFSGMAFAAAATLLLRLPPAAPVPDCPVGTNLYTRTVAVGKVLTPVQHCFREEDAQDPRP
jgi:hypothetical protein